ncbi:MAG: CHAP domain-containing protein [Candidatus Gastranaerophilales bacterium]|nr:CHAP domain-containing protein [Candidatus Gastranaerophilales bacterium]
MNFQNYLQKIALNGTANFGSLTNTKATEKSLNNLSLFTSASLDQLKNLDLDRLLEGADISEVIGSEGTEEDEALANAIRSFLDINEVQELANADGNEEITAEEVMAMLQSIMEKDGDNANLSLDDIDEVLKELGVDLEAKVEDAVKDALKEDEAKEVQEEEAAKKPQEAAEAAPASNAGGANRGSGAGGTGSTGNPGGTNRTTKPETEAETPEQIQAQIDEKNNEIGEIESQAEKDIQEQEQAKEKAMKQYGVSEDEYKEYQEKEQQLEQNIADTEKAIGDEDNKIADYNSTIESNNNYISSIDAQISANESMKASISGDDENSSSRIADIDSQIQNLQNEKAQKEQENQQLQQDIEAAENKKTELEGKKADYEQQKAELLNNTLNGSEGFGKGIPSSEVEKIKNNIASYDTKISDIRAKKDSDVAAVKGEIQTLQVKLKDAQAQEERNNFLKENSALNNGQSVVDFATQFNGKSASEMYQIMRNAGYRVDEGQWCADFVNFALGETIGKENLPDWYNNCNTASCTAVANAARSAGAIIDQSQVQPGDVVLFSKDGGSSYYHTGIVTSIDPDGTLHTMEGNTWTSNENWGAWQRSYNMNNGRTYTFVSMS